MNVHEHDNIHFKACLHEPLDDQAIQEKAWISPGQFLKLDV